jgi:hypothetical protein
MIYNFLLEFIELVNCNDCNCDKEDINLKIWEGECMLNKF